MKEGFYYGGEMIEELLKIKEELLGDIKKSTNLKELNEVRVKAFGKAGAISNLSKGMRDVAPEDRPKFGALINVARCEI